jgi:hypothetical protein
MSEILAVLDIDGQEYRLRFPGLAQILIQKKASEFLGLARDRMGLTDLMNLAASGDVEVQAYLLWQGIMGGMPELRKMKFEEAVELREKFLLGDGDPDDGGRYLKFLEAIGEAIDASFGADRKKSRAKAAEEKKQTRIAELEEIYLAKMRAEERLKAGNGIGPEPPSSASES